MEAPIVLIRVYRSEDDEQVKNTIYDGTMAPVNDFFKKALLREVFIQAIVMVSALLFILCGVHLFWTPISIPIVIVGSYVSIYFAHYYKAKYLHKDLNSIPNVYLSSDKTTFLVAEAFYTPEFRNSPPMFVTESEFEKLDRNGQMTMNDNIRKEVVGTCAIMRDRDMALTAWLRRMAVRKDWRGKGIGENLLDRIIKFCSRKGFVAIELVTTECHAPARALYIKKGFEVRSFFHKKILNLSTLAIPMYYMSFKTRPYKETTLDL